MRRASEAQFVVFSLKSLVQDLVGSRIKVFHIAIIAGGIKIVARQWMYPLSLHCRNASSSMRFVTRPCLQISQMTGSSSTAISDPLAVAPNPSQACTTFFEGCVSYFSGES
jgi:hypothetical protein